MMVFWELKDLALAIFVGLCIIGPCLYLAHLLGEDDENK